MSDVAAGDEITLLFALGLGPYLVPLRGKIPVFDAWQTFPPVAEPTVRDWLESGFNLGFRTGARSGLVVIDDDQPRHGGGEYVPPPTGLLSESPTGGRHYYYRAPSPCPHNSASRLAVWVDVRGEGGQVVVPPSVHPTARAPYRWVSTGEPGTFPPMPAAETVTVDTTRPAPTGQGYAETALVREAARVRAAPEGARNHALNRAAFSLGQLVAGGALLAGTVHAELSAAARIAGLPDAEAASTIRSGLVGGAKSPRTAPATQTAVRAAPTPTPASRDVLVPGSHILAGGEYVEQGSHAFAGQVLAHVAPDALYRRAGVLGTIQGAEFVPANVSHLRSIVDASVRLCAGKPPSADSDSDDPILVFRTCSRDLASIIFDYPGGNLRALKHIASHPVCIGSDFHLAAPGWNAASGVYMADPEIPATLSLAEACAVLEDVVADFPFQAAADRANFFGLLLTPILRPAIDEPVPMHLIASPMERTGKTKLVEIVFGITISGKRLAATQIGENEDEREKRILSWLLRGQSLVHMDNLTEFLSSPSLSSMLTASVYQGRILGSSSAPTIANGLTVVGTGNNVHATGEMTKRIVPIRLLSATESPETRTDFRHPDLVAYVTAERPRVLGALLGLVAAWKAAGRPLHGAGFGGFERWTAVVGGILNAAGYREWLTTMGEWRGGTDDDGQEGRALVAAWHGRYGNGWVEASKIYDLAVEADLYGWIDSGKTERARRRMFAVRVLNRLAGRVLSLPREPGDDAPAAEVRVESDSVGARRRVKLSTTSTTSTK